MGRAGGALTATIKMHQGGVARCVATETVRWPRTQHLRSTPIAYTLSPVQSAWPSIRCQSFDEHSSNSQMEIEHVVTAAMSKPPPDPGKDPISDPVGIRSAMKALRSLADLLLYKPSFSTIATA